MTKSLIRLTLLTTPIIFVIGLIRSNLGFITISHPSIENHNYLVIAVLTILFLSLWMVNIIIVRLVEKVISRYIISYLLLAIIVIVYTSLCKNYIFNNTHNILLHLFWIGLVFNTIILALINIVILKSKKDSVEFKLNELKRLKLEAEKKLLVQQLQPHFLFNALSTLKSLINEDQDKASNYTVKLSEFLRYTIASSRNDTVSISDELQFTEDYIKLQSERFVDAVKYSIDLPNHLLLEKVPVFSIQTLVENAFKHNKFSAVHPLIITIWYEDDIIYIKNNKLKKVCTNASTGTGLQNLKDRYRIIADSTILIKDDFDYFTVGITPINK